MWEIFKSKKRKELELIELEKEKEISFNEKQECIADIKRLNEKIKIMNANAYENEKKRVYEINNHCPKCNSFNVIDKISQIKGEIKGARYGDFGYINGNIDTLGINKCKDCEHEWKKAEYINNQTNLSFELSYLRCALKIFNNYENCTFDVLDLNENFNSFEEKKEELMKSIDNNFIIKHVKDFFDGTKIDSLLFIINKMIDDENMSESYTANSVKKYLDENILVNKLGFIK